MCAAAGEHEVLLRARGERVEVVDGGAGQERLDVGHHLLGGLVGVEVLTIGRGGVHGVRRGRDDRRLVVVGEGDGRVLDHVRVHGGRLDDVDDRAGVRAEPLAGGPCGVDVVIDDAHVGLAHVGDEVQPGSGGGEGVVDVVEHAGQLAVHGANASSQRVPGHAEGSPGAAVHLLVRHLGAHDGERDRVGHVELECGRGAVSRRRLTGRRLGLCLGRVRRRRRRRLGVRRLTRVLDHEFGLGLRSVGRQRRARRSGGRHHHGARERGRCGHARDRSAAARSAQSHEQFLHLGFSLTDRTMFTNHSPDFGQRAGRLR